MAEPEQDEHTHALVLKLNWYPVFTRDDTGKLIVEPFYPEDVQDSFFSQTLHFSPRITIKEASLQLHSFFKMKPDDEIFYFWHISHYQGPHLSKNIKDQIRYQWNGQCWFPKQSTTVEEIKTVDYKWMDGWMFRRHRLKFQGRITLENRYKSNTRIDNILEVFENKECDIIIIKISRQRSLRLKDLAAEQISKGLRNMHELDRLYNSSVVPSPCKEAIKRQM